ncbi:baculoviral IAP repeat-containing protein 2-like isoform X1 [Biomphalaria pfeifferi]|uniref:Baculoviral IAP repeat-containing protein 2-like isoform X1 n=1 Tax=Biomphalaria pfeifferi TaxID=112525 RepID=A0AAD8C215_BIOPF|nr:baculoviral IAP repeat-containing protein 2-like isoform X1 [Biomphalaria pfeifferi]
MNINFDSKYECKYSLQSDTKAFLGDTKCNFFNIRAKSFDWIFKWSNPLMRTDHFAFPVTSTSLRLNSFAPLLNIASKAQKIFFTRLANAGFRVDLKNSNVVCESCDQKWRIDNFDTPPESLKFHKWNCTFACRDVVNGNKPDINDPLVEVDGQPFYTCQESEDKHLTEQKYDTELFDSLKELQTLLEHKDAAHCDTLYGNTLSGDTFSGDTHHGDTLSGDTLHGDTFSGDTLHGAIHSGLLKDNSLVINKTRSSSLCPNRFLCYDDTYASYSKPPVLEEVSSDDWCLDTTVSNTSFDSGYDSTLLNDEVAEPSSSAVEETTSPSNCQDIIQPDVQHYQDALGNDSTECNNNSNHLNYMNMVQLRKLLRRNMRSPDLFKLFQLLKLLTVKITQTSDSSRGPHQVACGTGSLIDTQCQITTNATGSLCGIIFVETSQHLIRDDSQAKLSIVDFFVNTQIRSRQIRGESIQQVSEFSNGPVYLKCLTEEMDLLLYINQLQEEIKKLMQEIYVDSEDIWKINAFIISYPHGGEQAISYGRSVVLKHWLGNNASDDTKLDFTLQKVSDFQKGLENKSLVRKMLMYTAETCPGCSGAPVLTFRTQTSKFSGHKRLVMEKWMHHGYFKNEDLNVSYLKVCTDEDFMDWGWTSCHSAQQTLAHVQQITTNETALTIHQEINSQSVLANSSQVAASLSKEPTVCVANLVEHPSYPVYITLARRLQSFTHWTHCNIHAPSQLAAAGFFYAGYGDCVRCFQCGLGLRSWKPGDDVIEEHQKYRPSCSFLKTYLESSTGSRRQDEIPISQGNEIQSLSSENSPRNDSSYPRKHLERLICSIQVPQSTGSCNETSQVENSITETCQGKKTYIEIDINITSKYSSSSKRSSNIHRFSDCSNSTNVDAVSTSEQEETTLEIPQVQNINLSSPLGAENNIPELSVSSRADVTVQLLKKEKEMLKSLMKCKECRVNPIQELFLPCGDIYACSQCVNKFTHCPTCGQRILGTVTTYFA